MVIYAIGRIRISITGDTMIPLEEASNYRPYPIDPKQDLIVKKVENFAEYLFSITDRITYAASIFFQLFQPVMDSLYGREEDLLAREEKPASEFPAIHVVTKTEAMDAKFYYAIKEGKLWFKPISAHSEAHWKLFDNQGFAADQTFLMSVTADDHNLIVIDQLYRVHVAKTTNIQFVVSSDCPQWQLTRSEVNWSTKWFNMVGVAPILNLFKDPTLFVPPARSVAISYKGPNTLYYTDRVGKKHPEPFVGVTTLYLLDEKGTRIFFADPWLNNQFNNEITGPEDGEFVAEQMAASASTLLLIQRARNEYGQEIHKIYTRFVDFDSMGCNPVLPHTYDPENRTSLVRYLPPEDWLLQPCIVLGDEACLTSHIAILQTGRGQDKRQLRIQGKNRQGKSGYYYKDIYEPNWNFEETGEKISRTELLDVPHTGFTKGKQVMFDYEGILESKLVLQVFLRKFSHQGFNERGLHTYIEMRLQNGKVLKLPLYARRSWQHLIGLNKFKMKWTLVIPYHHLRETDLQVQQVLKMMFNKQQSLSVNVVEERNRVTIYNQLLSRSKFKMVFERCN